MAAELANHRVVRLFGYSVIPPWILEMTGQEVTKLQHSYEFMKQEGTAEVRQTSMFTGDFYTSRRIFHPEEILLKC
jgi:hypothetical protein